MNTIAPERTIGVLGGMGPLATLDFMGKVIRATPADVDQQHVPMIVRNVPQIPDRSAAILVGSDAPFQSLLEGVRQLEHCQVDAIVIPCNTAHFWHARLSAHASIPIFHIVDAVIAHLMDQQLENANCVLMATRGTLAANVYQQRANVAFHGVFLGPDENVQCLVDETIRLVKAGDIDRATQLGNRIVGQLLDHGADRVILACTELPIALRGCAYSRYCTDATEALARQVVKFATGSVCSDSV